LTALADGPLRFDCGRLAASPRTAASGQELPCATQKSAYSDHLIGKNQYRVGNLKPNRLRGLQVDHQLELGWGFVRQLDGLLAAKDAVDVGRCLPININIIAAAWSGATDATRGLCIPPAVCTQPGS